MITTAHTRCSQPVLAKRGRVDADDSTRFIRDALADIRAYMHEHDLEPAGPPFAITNAAAEPGKVTWRQAGHSNTSARGRGNPQRNAPVHTCQAQHPGLHARLVPRTRCPPSPATAREMQLVQDLTLPDEQRPLSDRGRRDANHLAGASDAPRRPTPTSSCSAQRPGARARRSSSSGAPAWAPARCASSWISTAPPQDPALLERLHRVPDGTSVPVMLIGHNPGLQELAIWLTSVKDQRAPGLPNSRRSSSNSRRSQPSRFPDELVDAAPPGPRPSHRLRDTQTTPQLTPRHPRRDLSSRRVTVVLFGRRREDDPKATAGRGESADRPDVTGWLGERGVVRGRRGRVDACDPRPRASSRHLRLERREDRSW